MEWQHLKGFLKNINKNSSNDFWISGDEEISKRIKSIKQYFGDKEIRNALDFGCGVGRLVKSMHKTINDVVGVDISTKMLEIAKKECADVTFLSYIPNKKFDWVNSFIVLQHIPPQKGINILNNLLNCVNDNGVFSIHITTFKEKKKRFKKPIFKRKVKNIIKGLFSYVKDIFPILHKRGTILMYDYDMNNILKLIVNNGFENIHLEHTNHGGFHGFIIYGEKLT